MKRIFKILVASMCLCVATSAQTPPRAEPNDPQLMEQEARRLAEELLTGKEIFVRIYNNWQQDPRSFELISIPLSGLNIKLSQIDNSSLASISDLAVIVALARDQKDEAVATVLGDNVCTQPYRDNFTFSIRPDFSARSDPKWWLFTDAVGEPIPHATVEIMIGKSPFLWTDTPRLFLFKTKLDETGRHKAMRQGNPALYFNFSFTLYHPDYCTTSKPVKPAIPQPVNKMIAQYEVPILPRDKWCIFNDALGNPIPQAIVEIFHGSCTETEYNQPKLVEKAKLDDKGRLEPPEYDPTLWRSCFIISHPDYGRAIIEPTIRKQEDPPLRSCIAPLVPAGTKADERSIWGTILDVNENPVVDAIVKCPNVQTPGGGVISLSDDPISGRQCFAKAITNRQGSFAMYLPVQTDNNKPSRLIPPAAEYWIEVEALKELNLKPFEGLIPSGQESTITLQPAEPKKYFPIMIFEDEFGPVTDPNMLKHVILRVEYAAQNYIAGPYDTFIQQSKFQPGTYYAIANWNGKHYIFEPIELTGESPETVIFKIKEIKMADVTCFGRVVDAITTAPIENTIIMYSQATQEDASQLKTEQWDEINSIDPYFDANDPTLEPLREIFKYQQITRTDSEGRFQITVQPGKHAIPFSLVAIKRDYMGAEQQLEYQIAINDVRQPGRIKHIEKKFEPDENGNIRLPDLKLFPAGTIAFEPNIPTGAKSENLSIFYAPSINDLEFWKRHLWGNTPDSQGARSIFRYQLQPNQKPCIYAPAYTALELRIYLSDENRWAPVFIPEINLEQGEVLDLGRLDFEMIIVVTVRVLDSTGKPVEGVAVSVFSEKLPIISGNFISGEDGTAKVDVPQNSTGEFMVRHYLDKSSWSWQYLQEGIPYEVAGQEDTGKIFTLQLSNEMLEYLFEEKF